MDDLARTRWGQRARDFAAEHLIGNELELVRGDPPRAIHRAFAEAGMANWFIGASMAESVEVVAQLAFAEAGVAFALFNSILAWTAIDTLGSPEQRRVLEAALREGTTFCSTAAAELECGSELTRMQTTVQREGDHLVVMGTKSFATNAADAAYFLVATRHADDAPGYPAVLIPRETAGLRVGQRWRTAGLHGVGIHEVHFDGCRVPASLASEANGLRVLEAGLNATRILHAATALGIAHRVMHSCLGYAASKTVANAPLFDHQVFVNKMGAMEADLETMAMLCRSAARDLDEPPAAGSIPRAPGSARKSALVAKLTCADLGWRVASMGSTLLGGLGYCDSSLMPKLLQDMRYVSVVEGGEDVVRQLLFSRFVRPRWLNSKG